MGGTGFRPFLFVKGEPEAPFGGFVRIVADPVRDDYRTKAMVKAVGGFETFVAPDFHRLATAFLGGVDHMLQEHAADAGFSSRGTDVESFKGAVGACDSYRVLDKGGLAWFPGDWVEEFEGDGADNLALGYGHIETVAIGEIDLRDIVKVGVIPVFFPGEAILVKHFADHGNRAELVGWLPKFDQDS